MKPLLVPIWQILRRGAGVFVLCISAIQAAPTGEELKEVYRQHQVFKTYYGAAGEDAVPLDWLAGNLKWPDGQLSLVVDPRERYEDRILVYLVNATAQTVSAAGYDYAEAYREMKVGDRWVPCAFARAGCWSPPRAWELPPGMARGIVAFYTPGEIAGEFRFCLTGEHIPPIVSAPFRGSISSAQLGSCRYDDIGGNGMWTGDPDQLMEDLQSGHVDEEFFASCFELDRFYGQSRPTRDCIAELLKNDRFRSLASSRFVVSLEQTLARPWEEYDNEHGYLIRCLKALATPNEVAQAMPFGSPERCRGMVWFQLTEYFPGARWRRANPERYAQLIELEKSGNPWGATHGELQQLVDLAEKACVSRSDDEGKFASEFLALQWVPSDIFTPDRCRALLTSDRPAALVAGLHGLIHRGFPEEAAAWMSAHFTRLGDRASQIWLDATYREVIDYPDWEIPILKLMIARDPLLAFESIRKRETSVLSPWMLSPPVLRESVVAYLSQEAVHPTFLSSPEPEPSSEKKDSSVVYDPSKSIGNLSEALGFLDRYRDPSDLPLIRRFLDYPATEYLQEGDRLTRYYALRNNAAAILRKRGEAIPAGTILKETKAQDSKDWLPARE